MIWVEGLVEFKLLLNEFVEECTGLDLHGDDVASLILRQNTDSKVLKITYNEIAKVLKRFDSEGKPFVQINLRNDKKLLLTDTLVGFKPKVKPGLEMGKIPKIVTTPDLLNVIEAIEDVMTSPEPDWVEVDVLKKLFYSVLEGAEEIGFDLSRERTWVAHIGSQLFKASA